LFELKELEIQPEYEPSADDTQFSADDENISASNNDAESQNEDIRLTGYLTGDVFGNNIGSGIAFPSGPAVNDLFLRIDFLPNRLFKYDGTRWVKQVDKQRTGLTPNTDSNTTQRSNFRRDNSTYIDPEDSTNTLPTRQSLSKAFTPKADNNG